MIRWSAYVGRYDCCSKRCLRGPPEGATRESMDRMPSGRKSSIEDDRLSYYHPRRATISGIASFEPLRTRRLHRRRQLCQSSRDTTTPWELSSRSFDRVARPTIMVIRPSSKWIDPLCMLLNQNCHHYLNHAIVRVSCTAVLVLRPS